AASLTAWIFFFFQAEDGIRAFHVTGVQTCALPILFTLAAIATHFLAGLMVVFYSLVVLAQAAVGHLSRRRVLEWFKLQFLLALEIGRASCRERAEGRGVGGGATTQQMSSVRIARTA